MEQRLKIALWIVPIIFSAGGFWALSQSSAGQAADRLDSLAEDVAAHQALKAHPISEERINTILTEQRAVRAEQKEQGEAIAAICAATGARCP